MSSEHLDGPEAQRHIQAELAQALRDLGLTSEQPGDASAGDSTSAEILPAVARIDRFSILERLGGGGQGDVYAAYDPRLDRLVALKLIRLGPEHSDQVHNHRLMREAHALARLDHPNVVRVHDTGTHGAAAFLVMEYKRNQTLAHWLAAERRPWKAILEKFLAAGRGLRAAHDKGIVHRDVKAENIFVDDHVGAVLGDFGLAYGLDDVAEIHDSERTQSEPRRPSILHQPLTANGHFPGTEGYIAPEAMSGRATALSDQYSFCVALFHALFGVMARPDERRWPARPRDAPRAEVVRALHRGLARAPAARFPDMAALLLALGTRSLRKMLLTGSGLLVAGATAALLINEEPAAACIAGARQKMEAVWPPERRGDIRAGFARVEPSVTERSAASFLKFADQYAQEWKEVRAGTCVTLSPEVEPCLDRGLARFDRLLTIYSTPSRALTQRALEAIGRLDPPSECRDRRKREREDIPDDMRRTLEDTEIRIAGGDYDGARVGIDSIRTKAVSYGSVLPWLRFLEGWLAGETRPDRRSDALLEDAVYRAGTSDDLATYAEAAIYRLKSLAVDLGEPDEAWALERSIEVFMHRAPMDSPVATRFQIELAEARGLRLAEAGDWVKAADQHSKALRMRRELFGDAHPDVAKSHHNRGIALSSAGEAHHDEARQALHTALELRRELLDPGHPKIAETEFGLAQMECEHLASLPDHDPDDLSVCFGDLADLLEDYLQRDSLSPRGLHRRAVAVANSSFDLGCIPCAERAIDIAEAVLAQLQESHHERSDTLAVRGRLAHARHQLPQARAEFLSGVALWEAKGRRDPTYFQHLGNAAVIAVDEWRTDLAVELLRSREPALADAACNEREAYAVTLDRLQDALDGVPDRAIDELRRAAESARGPCIDLPDPSTRP